MVGSSLGTFIDLFINDIVGESINSKIISSTTWVHKVDISDPNDTALYGYITEADYCIFKLQQLQKCDDEMLNQLIDRFVELDVHRKGSLVLGVEIPNVDQVVEMQRITSGTGMTLQEA